MDRFVVENSSLPLWLRTGFADEHDQVLLPCGAFGDELVATLCAAHDGVSVVYDSGHVYAPSSWLAEHHPRLAEGIRTIAENIERRLSTAEPMSPAS